MALEVLKCPNCGAPMPSTVTGSVVTCQYCGRAVTGIPIDAPARSATPPRPSSVPPAPPSSAPPVAPPASVRAPARGESESTPPQGRLRRARAEEPEATAPEARRPVLGASKPAGVSKAPSAGPQGPRVPFKGRSSSVVRPKLNIGAGLSHRDEPEEAAEEEEFDGPDFGWSDAEVQNAAREFLKTAESLYYAPEIPSSKEKNARETHKRVLERDEKILALYDDTVFGGADDGFVLTAKRLCWKNIMEDPQSLRWDEIDPDQVDWNDDAVVLMGHELQITLDEGKPLLRRLGELVQELSELAMDGDVE